MAVDKTVVEDGEVIVDLTPKPNGADKLEIEVVDDTPPEDRGRRPKQGPTAIPEEDEIGAYTKGVQDRIRNMRREYHDERRAKEEALRENERAIEFSKRILDQNKRLQKMLEDGQKSFKEVSSKSAENEISATRQALSQAIAAGDSEKIAEFNERMARATARAEAANHMPEMRFEEAPAPEAPKPRPQVRISSATQEWMDKNPWFDGNKADDQRMTAIAMAAHERLIRNGVRAETEAYFEGIDKEVREVFPDKFEDRGNSPPPRSPVAPTRRTPNTNPGKVKLTLSEQRVAEKLGVSLQAYAEQKMRREQMEMEK